MGKMRFTNGYDTVIAAPMNASFIVRKSSRVTRYSAAVMSTANK